MLKYLAKFAMDILPSVAATIIGAYIVNHYITPSRRRRAGARWWRLPKAGKNVQSPPMWPTCPAPGVKAKGVSEKSMMEKTAAERTSSEGRAKPAASA